MKRNNNNASGNSGKRAKSSDNEMDAVVPTNASRKKSGSNPRSGNILQRLALLEKKIEQKYVQLGTTNTVNKSTPLFILANPITRGDTVQDRDGDSVVLQRGAFRAMYYNQASAASQVAQYRALVVLDLEPAKTALTATILFGQSNPELYSRFNYNNLDMRRFRILADTGTRHPLTNYGFLVSATVSQGGGIDLKWNCNDLRATYDGGNNGTIADITKGAVWIIVLSDDNTNSASVYWQSDQFFQG